MTKKDLLELLSDFNDNDIVVVEVFDTILYEDLYDFSIDDIDLGDGRSEIRLCPIQKTTTEMKKPTYLVFLMFQLLAENTTLFDECDYEEMWTASRIHYGIFESSEWSKWDQTEYMEIVNYINNDLKEVLKPLS